MENLSQSTTSSVRDRLPDYCSLNLDDDDENTLDLITEVQSNFFDFDQGQIFDEADEYTTVEAFWHHETESDTGLDIDIDWTDEDTKYFDSVKLFKETGCGCTQLYDRPCCEILGFDSLEAVRLNMTELNREDLDLIVLAHLQQNRVNSAYTKVTAKHTKTEERKRSQVTYNLFGKKVCQKTYLFSHGIGIKRFKNLCKHYDEHGLTSRSHGNKGRRPTRAYTLDEEKHVITFITNYADVNAMPLPGRMPRMRDYTVMMLPSDTTKIGVWKDYVESCAQSGIRSVGKTKFNELWQTYLPNISVMKIASDLCDVCQTNNNLIMRSVNCSEDEKSNRLKRQENHLALAKECRDYYRKQCSEAAALIQSDDELNDISTHISFDYAQNLFVPHSPQQVGPIYFKTPRKCHLFGICCESEPRQVNYLIDEASLTGKGANETVSYLHHYLENHSNNPRSLDIHCDNCIGQNKNNCVMFYFFWRVMKGLNTNIEVSFMLPYHTRFGPDWCFGLIKLRYMRSHVSSVKDVGDIVDNSTTKKINVAQHVQDPNTGERIVPVYKWKEFFDEAFKHIPMITSYQHFRMSTGHPGVIFVRRYPSSPENEVYVFRNEQSGQEILGRFPEKITEKGLSAERAWYLYEHVRQHCSDETKDLTCPKPNVPKPKTSDILKHGNTKECKQVKLKKAKLL